MQPSENNNSGTSEWSYPVWAAIGGVFLVVFGIVDILQIDRAAFFPLSFLLAAVGAVVSLMNLDTARKYGVDWLPGGYLIWSLLDLLAVLVSVGASGMTRSFLHSISFRAPSWIVFGAWFAYYGLQIYRFCDRPDQKSAAAATGNNASALFKLSLVWFAFHLLVAIPPIAILQPSPNQTITLWPLSVEFIAGNDDNSGSLGFYDLAREKMDKERPPAFSLPWLGMWWFPAQIFVLPLVCYFVWKNYWRWLLIMTGLGALALFAIPLQLALQYSLPALGSIGFLHRGYFLLWVPVCMQILALLIARIELHAITSQEAMPAFPNKNKKLAFARPKNTKPAFARPRAVTVAAVVVVLIWTYLMPIFMRSGLESLMLAAKNKEHENFPIYLAQVKREIAEAPLETALCEALDQKQRELVEWLLEQKPDLNRAPNRQSYPPLWWALRGGGDLVLLEKLLQAGADPNLPLSSFQSETPLGMVLSMHYQDIGVDCIRTLASYGANLNAPVNSYGSFPVEYALSMARDSSDKNIVELIKLGADPLKCGRNNLFYLATSRGSPEIVKLLVAAGLAPENVDAAGNNFLHLLAKQAELSGRLGISDANKIYVPQLINHKNSAGLTPLHIAVENNNPTCVQELLNMHADPSIPDRNGVTPRGLAQQMRFLRVVNVIDNFKSKDDQQLK